MIEIDNYAVCSTVWGWNNFEFCICGSVQIAVNLPITGSTNDISRGRWDVVRGFDDKDGVLS